MARICRPTSRVICGKGRRKSASKGAINQAFGGFIEYQS